MSFALVLAIGTAFAPFAAPPARAAAETSSPTFTRAPTSPGTGAQPEWEFSSTSATQCSFGAAAEPAVWSGCTSPFTGAAAADGAYLLRVRAATGPDTSPSISATYVRDTTAGTTFHAPASPSADRAPVWGLLPEAGATTRCALDGGSFTPCSTSFVGDLTDAVDGPHAITVEVTDTLGNRDTVVSQPYVLDTTDPAPPWVDGPRGAGADVRSTWNIVAEPDAELTCRLLSNGVAGAPFVCSSSVERTLSNDGRYVLRVSQTDAAGNESPVTDSAPYTLDTQAFGRPVVTGPRSPSPLRSPVWNVQAEAGASTRCLLKLEGTLVDEVQPCGPTVSFTLASDGSYVVEAVATDSSGRTPQVGTSLPYVLDTTPPATPTVSGPAGLHNDPEPSWTFDAVEPGLLTCTLTAPDDSIVSLVCDPEGVTVQTLVLDGSYRLDVVQTDAAGNQSPTASMTYVLDTVAPLVRDVRLADSLARGAERSLTWSFLPEQADNGRLTCTLTYEGSLPADQPQPSGTPEPCGSSPFTLPIAPDLPDGTYRFGVSETDEAGNVGAPTTATYVLDTRPPARPVFTVEPMGPSRSSEVEWRVAPDAEAATRVCTLNQDGEQVATGPCETTYARDLTDLGEGVYELVVTAIDDLGNATAAVTSRRYTYDLTATGRLVWDSYPGSTLPLPLAGPGQTGDLGFAQAATPFTFHGEDDATFHCRLTRGPRQDLAETVADRSCDGAVPGTGRFVLGKTNASIGGTYWLTVTVTQPGQQAPGVSVVSFVLDLAPPGSPVFTSGQGQGSDAHPGFTWQAPTAKAGEQSTALCRLTPVTGPAQSWEPCPQGADAGTYDRPLPRFGTWALEVRLVDRAGRQGASETSPAYTYAPGSPERPVVSVPTNRLVGATETVFWSWQPPPPDVRVICELTQGTDLGGEVDCKKQAVTQDLDARCQGTYELTVTYENTAGGRSSTATRFACGGLQESQPTPGTPDSPGTSGTSGTSDGSRSVRAMPDRSALIPAGPREPVQSDAPGGLSDPVELGTPPVVVVRPVPPAVPATPAPDGRLNLPVTSQDPTPAPAPAPAPALGTDRAMVPGVPGEITQVLPDLVVGTVTRPTLPLALTTMVVLFLLVQNRIDRRDPKLAAAPLAPEPDLEFRAALRAPSGHVSDADQEPR